MTDESIADQLLRRKNELIEGWGRWVDHAPDLGEQCAMVDLRLVTSFEQQASELSDQASEFAFQLLGQPLYQFNDNSGPDYRTVVLDALDRCIAEAKDRGI